MFLNKTNFPPKVVDDPDALDIADRGAEDPHEHCDVCDRHAACIDGQC